MWHHELVLPNEVHPMLGFLAQQNLYTCHRFDGMAGSINGVFPPLSISVVSKYHGYGWIAIPHGLHTEIPYSKQRVLLSLNEK